MLRLPGLLHWWNRQKPKHVTDQTKTSDEEWWRQQSHCWAPFTDKTSNWPGLWTCITYSTDYYRFSIQFWTMEKKKSENEEKLSSMVGLFVILDNVPSSRSWSPENWRLMHNQSRSVQTHRSFNQLISNHLKDFILDDIQTINFLPSCLYHMVLSRSRSPKRLP